MIFNGQNFYLIPTIDQLSFSFNNTYVDNTGTAFIGFTSGTNSLGFTFSGGTLYDSFGKSVYKYNIGQPLSISGVINSTTLSYYINNSLILNNVPKTDIIFNNISINANNTNLISDIQISTNLIPLQVIPSGKFVALTELSGTINNISTNTVRIYGSNLSFQNSDIPLLTGNITGNVGNLNQQLPFSLNDVDSQFYNNLPVEFLLTLFTNIGTIENNFLVYKIANLSATINSLIPNTYGIDIPVLFFGSGLVNQFIYEPQSNASTLLNYYAFCRNYSGQPLPQTINFNFTPVSPLNSGYYQSNYVTGIKITNSGQYITCPNVLFTGYYSVTGFDWNQQSLLLSSGCTGNIPFTFKSINGYGAGASGYLTLYPILLSGIYNTGLANYNIVNNLYMISGGTGYTESPLIILNTGIYSKCYDVAQKSGYNYSIFTEFNPTYGSLSPLAAYLTGEVVCITGIVQGGLTGYLVSGILIDNPGSGYNSTNYLPLFSFIRSGGDSLTSNASGISLMKQSGLYLFNQNWSLLTGASSYGLFPFSGIGTGISGQFNLNEYQNYLSFQVLFSGLDYTQNIVAQLQLSNATGYTVTTLITGNQIYDIDPYFLKKKNIDDYLYFQPQNPLSFLLTQNELDTIYSSSTYSSNETINIGDLSF